MGSCLCSRRKESDVETGKVEEDIKDGQNAAEELPGVVDNTEGVEENIKDGHDAAEELPEVLNNRVDNTAPLKVQAQVPPDPHDPAAYNHPHAIVDDDEKLIRTELERDKYQRE
ncbi:PREDICTED: uncharacterized protein LOC109590235, partial [Amphimedon queenslandica]